MPTYKAISGARAVLKLDSIEVGWATGIQGTETIEVVPIAILGKVDVQDHEIVGRTAAFSASFVRIKGLPMTQIGGTGTGNFPTGPDISIGVGDILSTAKFTAEIFDQVDNKVIYVFENCLMTSRAFTVDRGGVIALNATFVSTRLKDESQVVDEG